MNEMRAMLGQIARYLGLGLVLLGGAGVSVGYLGARDAEARRAAAVQFEVRRVPASTTQRKQAAPTIGQKRIATSTKKKTATAQQPQPQLRRKARAMGSPAPQPTRRIITTRAPSPAATARWRRITWWGGGGIVLGLAGVAWSIYERPPQRPRSGADEMLNEPVPF